MSRYGDTANITGSLIVDGEIDLGSGDDDIVMDGDDNTLVVDGTNNRVGIGTGTPDGLLHISTSTTDAALILEADTDNNNEGDNPIIILRQDGGFVDSAIYHSTAPSNNDLHIASAINMIFKTSTNGRYASATAKMIINDTGEVGIGTTEPNDDAILELSSSDQGFMLPRVANAALPTVTSAHNGLMLYEEDTHRLKIVANGEWQTVTFEA